MKRNRETGSSLDSGVEVSGFDGARVSGNIDILADVGEGETLWNSDTKG